MHGAANSWKSWQAALLPDGISISKASMSTTKNALATLVKKAFRGMGVEVQRWAGSNTEEAVIGNLLRLVEPAAILDVGANTGQFARNLRGLGYAGTIISFEALPLVHAELMRNASKDDRWLVAPCAALGSSHGTAEMNVAGNSASSSLLPMLDAHLHAAPESAYTGKQTVVTARLDELSAEMLPTLGDVYLKIDTQGYELEVLKGAGSLLDRVRVIQVELSLTRMYDHSPTLATMVPYVEGLGFELFNLTPTFKDRRSGRLLQADGFFVRA